MKRIVFHYQYKHYIYCITFIVDKSISCVEVFGQSSGDLRLTSSNSSGQGRLEMFYQSIWTPFTINGFDMYDADLACKKLGYKYASRYAIVGTFG